LLPKKNTNKFSLTIHEILRVPIEQKVLILSATLEACNK